jgi:hypothetical protein
MKLMSPILAVLAAAPVAAQDHVSIANEVYDQVVFLRGLELRRLPRKEMPELPGLHRVLERSVFPGSARERQVLQYMLETTTLVRPRQNVRRHAAQVLARQCYGFYDAETDTIWLNRNSKKWGDFVVRMLMVGPLAQAIDEQYFGVSKLSAKRRGNHDALFAIGALREGAAAGMAQQWAVQERKKRTMPELVRVRKFEDARNRTCFESTRYFSSRMAMGLMGLHFLTQGKGSAALMPHIPVGFARNAERAYKDPPRSSEQILHPEKYWDRRDPPVELTDPRDFESRLARRFALEILRRDTLGEFYCAILARPSFSRIRPEQMRKLVTTPRYWTLPAGEGWGGDQLFVVEKNGKRGITWITWWDSEKDASEFHQAYFRQRGRRARFQRRQDGRLVVFGYGCMADYTAAVLNLVRAHARPRKGKAPFDFTGAHASPK